MDKGNGFTMSEGPSAGKGRIKIDFSSFILSLYSSGLVQLGKVEEPSTGKKTINLDLARHTIEMIAMLKEKTKGNLTEEEDNLLNALLSEIRLAYVEAKA
ncbi:MAG: DUF1844 domain-containing protein [Desulfobacula sp.]|jgi:hypothetical protein|uniref:DUF1844 domain-containing protein n=1 Tax=Desulfobacula sp. TaxID=2593537 RepID=UPI001DC153A7|nr:DUF1844 domain-containing protein [Desulfobacula sp.]MBT3483795.1 DUF1844 domain-containing protein [Desulfobacula sp.]MBT3802983.1 DUF1844 domain-containing protein [Desulfobacula sp.]MBT4023504.1 DUF1844 domain-containing protein [Desulfobacula sp.]MBT4197031.1 DUF1844 domain-containing protein [Desulfobacula sp.]